MQVAVATASPSSDAVREPPNTVPGLEQPSIEVADGSLRCIGHFAAYAMFRGGPIVAASGPKDST